MGKQHFDLQCEPERHPWERCHSTVFLKVTKTDVHNLETWRHNEEEEESFFHWHLLLLLLLSSSSLWLIPAKNPLLTFRIDLWTFCYSNLLSPAAFIFFRWHSSCLGVTDRPFFPPKQMTCFLIGWQSVGLVTSVITLHKNETDL